MTTIAAGPSAPGPWVDVTGNLVGMDSECGNLSYVSARPDRDEMIVGVAKQGLWVSDNGAPGWIPLGRGPGSATIDNRTTAIVYDPSDPNTFWQSGGYGEGVFKTTDNGASFDKLGTVAYSDLVSVDFTDPARRTLVSGTHERPNVYRSTDGGKTWKDIAGGLPADIGATSYPYVIDADTYLLGTHLGASSGVFRTADGGATWSLVYDGDVSGPMLAAKSDGHFYWLLNKGGLITSSDNGVTWTKLESSAPDGSGDQRSVIELPDGSLATLAATNVIVSSDHGASWRAVGPGLPYAPTGMTYSASRHAFYIWRYFCDVGQANNPVLAQAIMRLDADLAPG